MSIALDASTSGGSTTASSLTFSHTCTGANLRLVVDVLGDSADSITGVTYNGVAMTQVAKKQQASSGPFVYSYTLVGPATGAHNVVISASGSITMAGFATSYKNCSQGGIDTSGTSSGNFASNSDVGTTITVGAGANWMHMASANSGGVTPTAGSSTTQRQAIAGFGAWDSNGALSAGSHTLNARAAGTQNWGEVAFSFGPYVNAAQMPKPTFPQLNRSHTLAQSLVMAITSHEGSGKTAFDVLRGLPLTLSGTTAWASRIVGSVLNFPGSATAFITAKSGKTIAGQKNSTLLIWMEAGQVGVGSVDPIYAERGSSGNDIYKMENTTGGIARLTYRDDGGTLNQPAGTITIADGNPHVIIFQKAGTTFKSYVDGVLDINTTLTAGDTFTNATNETRIGGDLGDNLVSYHGYNYLTLAWTRTLSAEEIAQITADPFQIFRKKTWSMISVIPHSTTKSLQYAIKTTPAAKTKSLRYAIKKSNPVTKSLKYCTKAPVSKTKTLKYCVKKTATAITKSLRYCVAVPTPKTKSLKYSVKGSVAVTKSLTYATNPPLIVFDNSTDGGAATATSLTFSHTTAGANRILFVTVLAGGSISSVTYNGVAMTQAVASGNHAIFYLVNPTIGANNVVITCGSSVSIVGKAASYYNARQTSQPDSIKVQTNNGISSGAWQAITNTSVHDNSWMLISTTKTGAGQISAGGGTTQRKSSNVQFLGDSNGPITPSGNNSMNTFATDGTQNWTDLGVTFMPLPRVTSRSTTKSLKYSIRKTRGPVTKSLRYTVKARVPITKSLRYTVKARKIKQKSLTYAIKYLFYSREETLSLATNNSDLSTLYTNTETATTFVADGNRVTLTADNGSYAEHMFKSKNYANKNTRASIRATIVLQSDVSATVKPILLQVYNQVTHLWETVASNSTTHLNTDITLTALISTNTANYYDATFTVTFRLYQQAPSDS